MPGTPSPLETHRFLERQESPLYGMFILATAAVVVTFFVWASFFEIDVVVRALSLIRPATNTSTLKNATPGTVGRKAYVHGESVQAGHLLWKIDTTSTEVDRQNTEDQLGRLKADLAQLDRYAESLEARENRVPLRYPEAYHRAVSFFANAQKLQLQCSIQQAKWERESRLPPAMVLAQTIQASWEDWQLSRLDLEKTWADEEQKVYADRKVLVTTIESLHQRMAELRRLIRESEVRAPISGVVEDLKKFNVNDFLVAGEEVVRIVPTGTENLKLELRVDPRDIAEIRVGQTVTNLFPGLPPSRFGSVLARVVHVPADSMVSGQVAYFPVEAALARSTLDDPSGRHIGLKPGMNADSRIIVSRKTILNLVLEKLEFIQ